MKTVILTWICVYLGVTFYFLFKAMKNAKDATAANEPFSYWAFIKADLADIITAYILAFLLLISGGTESAVAGITFDIESYLKSFATGIGISSVGVNIFLGLFGLGDNSRKQTRRKIDKKTNELDKMKSE